MSAGPTLSDLPEPEPAQLARTLRDVRADVLRRPDLACAELRVEITAAYDRWFADRFGRSSGGVALLAVGSYGRRTPAPFSDLDLVLLHDGRFDPGELGALAEALWYPIWDSGLGLDHSVRTAAETLAVTRDDLTALLGLLDLRPLAGDLGLGAQLRTEVLQRWRAVAPRRVGELADTAAARWRVAGEGAYLLEPNLKESRGALRDGGLLRALALAQLVDLPPAVRAAETALLDVRGELHRGTGRGTDVFRAEEQAPVAAALGLLDATGQPDRDEVLRRVNAACRTVAHTLDAALRRVTAAPGRAPLRRRWFGPSGPLREPLAADVVAQDGEVVLARDADPARDPGLVLRAARAAAERGLPIASFALERLAAESAALPASWSLQMREDFVALLGTGHAAIPVVESLDVAGLLEPLLPEWAGVRSRAQHNPVHRHTVDRHLLETAACARDHTRSVQRPDLLLIAALLHDVGKGQPGDHSIAGADLARAVASRMGFPPDDVETVVALVRHHLLLPDTATRRDIEDPQTVRLVADRIGNFPERLALLHALTIADAVATGPAAWSDWKATLVADLVSATRAALHGESLPPLPPLDDRRRELARSGELAVIVDGREIVVAVADAVGVLHRTAGVLALHLLDVRSASVATEAGMAVNAFTVEPRFGRLPDAALLRADLARALSGDLPLDERLREKEQVYGTGPGRPPTVLWFDDEATAATVLEIRTEDALGLLTRLTAALEECGLDIRSARISSLGHSVVNAFYVTTRAGAPVPEPLRAALEARLSRA